MKKQKCHYGRFVSLTLLDVFKLYSPSSAKFPKAIRHISVRAVLWEWMPSSFTRVGITPILISWACKESAKKTNAQRDGQSIRCSKHNVELRRSRDKHEDT